MKILVAVDGSDHSIRAAKMAARIAKETRGSLTVLMAVEPPRAPPEYVEDLRRKMRKMAQKTVDGVAAIGRKERADVKTQVIEGHVPAAILGFAERRGFDLIVVGSRGLSGVGRLLLGSVSGAVVQRAKTSVLVVR